MLLSVYQLWIPNDGPTLELPWYSYIGMTTKDPWVRMKEHQDKPKDYNWKFEVLRNESDHSKWRLNILQQYNYHFNDTRAALEWLAPKERQEIAFHHTYSTYKKGYGLNKTPGGDYSGHFYGKNNTSGVRHLWWHKGRKLWRFRICNNDGKTVVERESKDLKKLIDKLRKENINIEDHVINQDRFLELLKMNDEYLQNKS